MYISEIQIKNYKSFYNLLSLELKPGLNLIVGQNNAGKTALLEAISLRFSSTPHRSLLANQYKYHNAIEGSQVDIKIKVKRDELFSLIRDKGLYDVKIPFPDADNPYPLDGETYSTEQEYYRGFIKILFSQTEYELGLNIKNSKFEVGRYPTLGKYMTSASHIEGSYDFLPCRYKLDSSSVEVKEPIGRLQAREKKHADSAYDWAVNFALRVYYFKAERRIEGRYKASSNKTLDSDARNLAQVLQNFQGYNTAYNRYLEYIKEIFPQIKGVSVIQVGENDEVEIFIRLSEDEDDYYAISLSECGTGIGQVLAILYVVLTSKNSKTIIIDEPQSFLHPAAGRKLIEILKDNFSQHQYIIATHSPEIIAAADSDSIFSIKHNGQQSEVMPISTKAQSELRALFDDLGVSLSDVFGMDKILWVEGETEELCFKTIVNKLIKKPLKGIVIKRIKHTSEFTRTKVKEIVGLYLDLSQGNALLPPALYFYLDSEKTNDDVKKEIQNIVRGLGKEDLIDFLPRTMYENYLLSPKAIAFLIKGEIKKAIENTSPSPEELAELEELGKLEETDVKKWLEDNKERIFDKTTLSKDGKEKVHAGKLLIALFSELTQCRVDYSGNKKDFGHDLTEWLIENAPEELDELKNILDRILFDTKQE